MKNRRVADFWGVLPLSVLLLALTAGCNRALPQAEAGEDPSAPGIENGGGGNSDGIVRLTADQRREFGIETSVAGPGKLNIVLTLPGDVALDTDRIAHVAPRVPGVVREVRKNLGDTVRKGEVMAVLDSRELADAAAALSASRERIKLAQSNFDREESLWKKKLSPELDYVEAQNALAEANIEAHTAEQKLRALGFTSEQIHELLDCPSDEPVRCEMTAPFAGTVIEKHISLGELLKDGTPAFVVADLSSVWVNLDVHQKDLPFIRVGQTAVISAGEALPEVKGRVTFIEPIARETPRTVHARVVVPNVDGRWRPGLFVTGRIEADETEAALVVPKDAVLMVEGKMSVFVEEGDHYRFVPVTTGREDDTRVEIVSGLEPGRTYVSRGAFTLKSELEKPAGED